MFLHDLTAFLKDAAPALAAGLAEHPADGRRDYLHCQVAGLYASATLEPLERFTEITEHPQIALNNHRVRVFAAENADISNIKISGGGTGTVWISSGAVVRGATLSFLGRSGSVVFGPASRVTTIQCQLYDADTKWIQGAGATMEWGSNLLLHEDRFCILVGDDCMISTYVYMRSSDSHGIYSLETGKRLNLARSIILHRHSWISRAALLNKGTEIGPDAILGQGAVASGKLAANAIHSGAPAMELRSGVTWDRSIAPDLASAAEKRASDPHYIKLNGTLETILEVLASAPPPEDRLAFWSRAFFMPMIPGAENDKAIKEIWSLRKQFQETRDNAPLKSLVPA